MECEKVKKTAIEKALLRKLMPKESKKSIKYLIFLQASALQADYEVWRRSWMDF